MGKGTVTENLKKYLSEEMKRIAGHARVGPIAIALIFPQLTIEGIFFTLMSFYDS